MQPFKIHNSVGLECQSYTIKFTIFSSLWKRNPVPLAPSTLPHFIPDLIVHQPTFCLYGSGYLGYFTQMEPYNTGISATGSFHVTDASLVNKLWGSSMWRPAADFISFYCKIIFHCVAILHLIYLLTSCWTLGHFHFPAIGNNRATNTCFPLGVCFQISLVYTCAGIAGSYGNSMLNLSRNCQTEFQSRTLIMPVLWAIKNFTKILMCILLTLRLFNSLAIFILFFLNYFPSLWSFLSVELWFCCCCCSFFIWGFFAFYKTPGILCILQILMSLLLSPL